VRFVNTIKRTGEGETAVLWNVLFHQQDRGNEKRDG
jgi:hypothetical protein